MDQELSKLLIETLRDLKNNASPDFNELVAQSSGYHMIYVWAGLFLIIVSMVLAYYTRKTYCSYFYDHKGEDVYIGFALCACLLFITGFTIAASNIGLAIYPLGNVIGKLG